MLVNTTTVIALFVQIEATIVPVKDTPRPFSKSYQQLAKRQTRNTLFLSVSCREVITAVG